MTTKIIVAAALSFSILAASCSSDSNETQVLAAEAPATTAPADVVEPTAPAPAQAPTTATEPTATTAAEATATIDTNSTAVPEATETPTEVAPTKGSLVAVGAWSGAAYMRSVTGETCPPNPVLTLTDGEFTSPLLQVPGNGVILAADFPNEQSVGYVVSDCDGQVQLHRFETGSSGEIIAQPDDQQGLSFSTDPQTAALIGWETYTSVRLGNQIIDLATGSVTPIAAGDPSVRTLGITLLADDAPYFRYVTDQSEGPDCTSAPLVVENRQTGERLPALIDAEALGPVSEFKSNGVGGLVAWTSTCGATTSLHSARVDPTTGALLDHTQRAQADSAIVFTLHVHGELKAWAATDLANGDIAPLVRVDLAPNLP